MKAHTFSNHLYILGLLSVLITSCWCPGVESETEPLIIGIKDWTPYQKDGLLIFEKGELTDTLFINSYSDEFEEYSRGDECPSDKIQTIRVSLFNQKIESSIEIELGKSDEVVLSFENERMVFDEGMGKVLTADANSQEYSEIRTVNGKTFQNVLSMKCNDCNQLNHVLFSKGLGLVAYSLNGEYWILKELN